MLRMPFAIQHTIVVNRVYGTFKAVQPSERSGKDTNWERRWQCQCVFCGQMSEKPAARLVKATSEGKKCRCKNGVKDGRSFHPLYATWRNMKLRCFDPKDPAFHNYGGRGIKVCRRWRESFFAFIEDMGPRPKSYTLERVNNDKNYCPQNCRWIPKGDQSRNTRKNRKVVFEGKEMIAADFARLLGKSPSYVTLCLKNRNMTPEETARCARTGDAPWRVGRKKN